MKCQESVGSGFARVRCLSAQDWLNHELVLSTSNGFILFLSASTKYISRQCFNHRFKNTFVLWSLNATRLSVVIIWQGSVSVGLFAEETRRIICSGSTIDLLRSLSDVSDQSQLNSPNLSSSSNATNDCLFPTAAVDCFLVDKWCNEDVALDRSNSWNWCCSPRRTSLDSPQPLVEKSSSLSDADEWYSCGRARKVDGNCNRTHSDDLSNHSIAERSIEGGIRSPRISCAFHRRFVDSRGSYRLFVPGIPNNLTGSALKINIVAKPTDTRSSLICRNERSDLHRID